MLIDSLYKIGAIKLGHFTLKSGQTSKIYLDLRQIISHPALLREVADTLWQKIRSKQFDLMCGVPYTALPIATCMSLQNNIPMIMRRKEAKSYGTKQQIEGTFQAGQSCLIIEDLITTGSSILETADELENVGLKIQDAVALIDRQQTGHSNLQKRNINIHTVFTLNEILHHLLKADLLSKNESAIVNELIHQQA